MSMVLLLLSIFILFVAIIVDYGKGIKYRQKDNLMRHESGFADEYLAKLRYYQEITDDYNLIMKKHVDKYHTNALLSNMFDSYDAERKCRDAANEEFVLKYNGYTALCGTITVDNIIQAYTSIKAREYCVANDRWPSCMFWPQMEVRALLNERGEYVPDPKMIYTLPLRCDAVTIGHPYHGQILYNQAIYEKYKKIDLDNHNMYFK